MGEWNIYDSNGQVKAIVKKLEYNGEFMGERTVVATLYSPSPMNLQVGDYITYRNEVFSIDYDPSVLKQSRNDTYGQGYVYDSVKFNSRQMELVFCKFLDYVIADNQIHYSSQPNFSFYCETITALTDRIKANLDRLYTGANAWTITVNTGNVNVSRINIDVQGMTCWDALGLIADKFDSTFVIRGRTITVAPSTNVLDGLYQYGKGNGLKTITRSSDSSQGIVTRLRAMGNTTNMPYNYYRNKDMYVYAPITDVYGPYSSSADIHTTLDFNACFNAEYGTNPLSGNPQYRCTVSLDMSNWVIGLFTANGTDPGYSVVSIGYLSGDDPTTLATFLDQLESGVYTRLYFEHGVNKDKWPSNYKEYTGSLGVTTGENRLMLPDYPDVTTDPYIDSVNISKYGIREESIIFDGSNGLDDIYPTIQGMTAEQARAAGATIDLDYGDNGHLDEIVSATQIADDGIPPVDEEGSSMVETFNITLKDIGFDINDYLTKETATISMRNGKCEGREFEIQEVTKSGNKYVLKCKRTFDESLNRYFPYNDYNLTARDKFVLLHIEMPGLYVETASQRLQDAAEAYLAEIDHSVFVIEPKIDNVNVQRHDDEVEAIGSGDKVYDTIYEGMLMQILDEDLDIDDAIFIDHLTIKEEEELIPQYEVVLRNQKTKSKYQQIQQQITDIKINGVSGGSGYVDSATINQLIKNYGDNRFLRKDIIDKLKLGVQLGDNFVSGLLGYGGIFRKNQDGRTYLEADELYIRAKAYFDTIEVRKLQYSSGNRVASAAGIKCVKVEYINPYGNVTEDLVETVKFRCYFRMSDSDGNPITNDFVEGDLARGQEFNLQGGLRSYWRKVVGTSGQTPDEKGLGWIELSNVSGEYSTLENGIPQAQDDIVQLGNVSDTGRQGAIIEYSTGGGNVPSYQIYQGINTFSLENKNYIDIGYNPSTGRAYTNVYGDFYYGSKDNRTYIRYNQDSSSVEIKAKLNVSSTIGNESVADYVESIANTSTQDIRDSVEDLSGDVDELTHSTEQGFLELSDNLSAVSEEIDSIVDDVSALDTIRNNILRNTGFNGDYETESTTSSTNVSSSTPIYSDPFDHWVHIGASVVNYSSSASLKAVELDNGSLSQTMDYPMVVGKKYIFSLRGNYIIEGDSVTVKVGGHTETIALTSNLEKYIVKFTCTNNSTSFKLSGSGRVMELQLIMGTLSTGWTPSHLDKDEALAYYQQLGYLADTIVNASTKIVGGLVLTQVIKVGNYRNRQMTSETGGMSGLYNDGNSPFLWGGGTLEKALYTIAKYRDDPTYQPTNSELSNMANFVVTHGGRAILNDIVLRGYIYALGGIIAGINIENNRLGVPFHEEGFHISNAGISYRNSGMDFYVNHGAVTRTPGSYPHAMVIKDFTGYGALAVEGSSYIDGDVNCSGQISAGALRANNAPSGSFVVGNKTYTITNGIITSITENNS